MSLEKQSTEQSRISIKSKLLLVLLLVGIIPMLLISIVEGVITDNGVNNLINDMLHKTSTQLESNITEIANKALGEATIAASLPSVIDAYNLYDSTNNLQLSSDYLANALMPVMAKREKLLGESSKIHFHTSDAKSFLRSWTNRRGDNLSSFRNSILKTIATKDLVSGIEPGRAGLVIRGISPIFSSGKYLGSVESIKPITTLFSSISADPNSDVAVFMLDTLRSITTQFKEVALPTKSNGKQKLNGFSVISYSDSFAMTNISAKELNKGKEKYTPLKVGHFYYALFPLKQYNGKTAGVVVVQMRPKSIIIMKNNILKISIVIIITLIVIIIAISLSLANSIVNPINKIIENIIDISNTKVFSKRLSMSDNNSTELHTLTDSFNRLLEEISGLIINTQNMTKEVQKSTEISVNSTTQLASTAEELSVQSEAVTEIANNISNTIKTVSNKSNNILIATNDISDSSNSVSEKMRTVAAAVEEGQINLSSLSEVTNELSSTISVIAKNSENAHSSTIESVKSVADAQKKIKELTKASTEIRNVLSIITDIADQTKLLALNATIEAARAGEAGKGFAVVANEVKQLAQQTNSATTLIREGIDAISNSSKNTVDTMSIIEDVISNTSTIISEIVTAVDQQSSATENNAKNISEMVEAMKEISNAVSIASMDATSVSENIVVLSNDTNNISQQIDGVTNGVVDVSNSMIEIVEAASNTSNIAQTVSESSENLTEMSNKLTGVINEYHV